MGYSIDERETALVYEDKTKSWTFYSCVPKHIHRLMSITDNYEVLEWENERPIAIHGKLNEKQVSMRKERKLSEEQKKAMSERMKKHWKNKRDNKGI